MSNTEDMWTSIINCAEKHKTSIAVAAVSCLSLYLLRRHFAGGVCTSTKRLDGKTVIITGSNTGIGRETALDLAGRGARVILACRDVLKAERVASDIVSKTGSKSIVVQQLDLASLESVRKFAGRILSQEARLDILINNAGVMACPEWKTRDGFEMQLGTNHLGHFLLTNLLLDLLKKSKPSRIINVSSLAHSRGKMHFDNINLEGSYEPWKAYGQSKLANVLFTRELARRLADSGVVIMSLHPGAVATDLARHLPRILQILLVPISLLMVKTPVQGSQTTIHCSLLDPWPEMESGRAYYFSLDIIADDGVTSYSLHPGVIRTELGRHIMPNMPLHKKIGYYLLRPIVMKRTVEGAQTTLHCALEDDLVNGAYYSDCAVKETAPQAQSDEDARRLWEISEDMVGLKEKH